ncbi:hypothetical protein [Streptomyces radiopugnans]|uniref:Secreted protein n=1 Tax=Streptomyces radiopugnans TaxID=403935 RepID=A0A1H8ZFB0_9ACTN|nr:hypothetical protein [Streptomyces radiopugnans]SEP63073.1 hypothetical protein SAMN05216481_101501 [Streptomyces radiopugnans]
MSTGLIITLIVAAVVVLAIALFLVRRGGGPHSVKRRFGPEYERTVAQHNGDAKAAERELRERLQRHGELRTKPLTAQEREEYEAQWAAVQERFVDAPVEAVASADRLLSRLAEARGFPGDGYDEQVSALSVHHPRRVQGYREVHAVAVLAREGQADTERLREALVHARALYEDLMERSAHDSHGGGPRHEHDRDRTHADGTGSRGHGRLSERLHLPGALRRHDTSGGRA